MVFELSKGDARALWEEFFDKSLSIRDRQDLFILCFGRAEFDVAKNKVKFCFDLKSFAAKCPSDFKLQSLLEEKVFMILRALKSSKGSSDDICVVSQYLDGTACKRLNDFVDRELSEDIVESSGSSIKKCALNFETPYNFSAKCETVEDLKSELTANIVAIVGEIRSMARKVSGQFTYSIECQLIREIKVVEEKVEEFLDRESSCGYDDEDLPDPFLRSAENSFKKAGIEFAKYPENWNEEEGSKESVSPKEEDCYEERIAKIVERLKSFSKDPQRSIEKPEAKKPVEKNAVITSIV